MTIVRSVNGLVLKGHSLKEKNLIVRFTSDERGESLSISDDTEVMLLIPFEGMEEFIRDAREIEPQTDCGWR